MDYRVFFTKKALAELADIADYIAADSPDAASRFGNALLDHVGLLGRFPRMGPVADERSQVSPAGSRPQPQRLGCIISMHRATIDQ